MLFLQQAPQAQGGGATFFIGLIVIYFVIFYFIFIRPRKLREQKRQETINTLQKGSDVITNGGIVGKIHEVENEFLHIEISKAVYIKVLKQAVNPIDTPSK